MKNNISHLILKVLCTSTLVLSQATSAAVLNNEPSDIAYPTEVQAQRGLNYWAYYLTKKIVIDIDKTLSDVGLKPDICGYRSKDQKIYYYQQLGQCFFNAFLEYRNDTSEKIIVYSWLKDRSEQTVSQTPMKIVWSRPEQSFWTTVKQYVQMRFEDLFESSTPVSTNFLAGSFSLFFPNEEAFHTILKKSILGEKLGPFADVTTALQATHFELSNSGKRSEQNYMIYQGQLTLQFKAQNDIDINVETDINVAKLQRPFYIHGNTEWQAQQKPSAHKMNGKP